MASGRGGRTHQTVACCADLLSCDGSHWDLGSAYIEIRRRLEVVWLRDIILSISSFYMYLCPGYILRNERHKSGQSPMQGDP